MHIRPNVNVHDKAYIKKNKYEKEWMKLYISKVWEFLNVLHLDYLNLSMSYSSNSPFCFQNKKIKNKIKTDILTKIRREDFKCIKNQAAILNEIGSLIVSYFTKN